MADTMCRACGFPLVPGSSVCGRCGEPEAGQPGAPPLAAAPAVPSGAGWPPADGSAGVPDVASGQATPNSTYLGQRLLYEKVPEAKFDPLTNTRYLGQLARHAILYFVIFLAGGFISAIGFVIVGFAVGFGIAFSVWINGGILAAVVIGCLFWLLPVPALLSEWKFLVDGKAMAAPMTFEHITWALRRRQTPLDSVGVRRLRLPGRQTRDYLELRRGVFAGFACCFGHGRDLYVGWTFWIYLSPLRWQRMSLARVWHNVTRRGTDLYVTLSYDYAGAMREAMHNTAREGIDVAVGQIPPQGQGIVGTAVGIAETDIGR